MQTQKLSQLWFVLLVSVFTLPQFACKKLKKTPEVSSSTKQYFANSRRRFASDSDRKGIARVTRLNAKEKCTGFFLKTFSGKTVMATAKHCLYYLPPGTSASAATTRNPAFWDIDRWCANGGQAEDATTGTKGGCKEGGLRIGDANYDIALIEMSIFRAQENQDLFSSFRLGEFIPSLNTPITMIGFPDDVGEEGKDNNLLVVTENCWVTAVDSDAEKKNYQSGDMSTKARHNCTTQWGNSGGPMILEGTAGVVIGMPDSYVAGDNTQYMPDEKPLTLNLFSDFINKHRDELSDIWTATTQPRSVMKGNYFARGTYSSKEWSNCQLDVTPLYLSESVPSYLMINYLAVNGGDCRGTQIFICNEIDPTASSATQSLYSSTCTSPNYNDPANPNTVINVVKTINNFEYIYGTMDGIRFNVMR